MIPAFSVPVLILVFNQQTKLAANGAGYCKDTWHCLLNIHQWTYGGVPNIAWFHPKKTATARPCRNVNKMLTGHTGSFLSYTCTHTRQLCPFPGWKWQPLLLLPPNVCHKYQCGLWQLHQCLRHNCEQWTLSNCALVLRVNAGDRTELVITSNNPSQCEQCEIVIYCQHLLNLNNGHDV